VRIDRRLPAGLGTAGSAARDLEGDGFDGVWSAEAGTDPFLPLALAAHDSSRIQIGTNIVVAFGRSPMTVAASANDLQAASRGRMILGLGSQIRPHIEKRYSMPWSHPAARMREFVLALRAIWASWNDGVPLDFKGDFYTHTLMTPFFAPPAHTFGPPKVFVAAVGPAMTRVAAEVCDGLLVHPFTTERYLREVTVPAVEGALAASGRSRGDFEIAVSPMVVTGDDEEAFAKADRAARREVAFHASTPAYRPVLDLHGWGELQVECNRLSKEGQWRAMTDLISDDVLDAFALRAPTGKVASGLLGRFGGAADRLAVHHGAPTPAQWELELVAGAAGTRDRANVPLPARAELHPG
jgi:probable F420-dependent oxidoreductase